MYLNKCSIFAVTTLLALSLCACGAGGGAEGDAEEGDAEEARQEESIATSTNDYDQGTGKWECGGLLFNVPSSWTSTAMEDGTGTFYYPPTGSGLNYLMVKSVAVSGVVQTEAVFNAFVDGIAESTQDYAYIHSQLTKNVHGTPMRLLSYDASVEGYPVYCDTATFEGAGGAVFLSMVTQQGWAYDYSDDFVKIVDSVLVDNRGQAQAQQTKPTATLGQLNALEKALGYLNYTAFSARGLSEQLEYEGFGAEEIEYAVANCGADWNAQAAKKAQSYLDYTSFSRSGLIDQLLFEGFTQEQAEYGATAVGY